MNLIKTEVRKELQESVSKDYLERAQKTISQEGYNAIIIDYHGRKMLKVQLNKFDYDLYELR